jgi:predicted RNase H-like HicB family nuclease
MSAETYHITADWDSEAGVWVATSEDVPGLATEAETIERLTAKLRVIVPELLETNRLLPGDAPREITFELTGHRHELIRLAS